LSPLVPRPLRPEELPLYEKLGRRLFPDADWKAGIKRVSRLLARWPDGLQTVWYDDQIVGYMGLWPLSAEAASNLESGKLTDNGIDADTMPHALQGRIQNWIMTVIAVAIQAEPLRREAIQSLLAFLDSVRRRNAPTRIYAHAKTADGHRFCARTGFHFLFPHVPQLCVLDGDQ